MLIERGRRLVHNPPELRILKSLIDIFSRRIQLARLRKESLSVGKVSFVQPHKSQSRHRIGVVRRLVQNLLEFGARLGKISLTHQSIRNSQQGVIVRRPQVQRILVCEDGGSRLVLLLRRGSALDCQRELRSLNPAANILPLGIKSACVFKQAQRFAESFLIDAHIAETGDCVRVVG